MAFSSQTHTAVVHTHIAAEKLAKKQHKFQPNNTENQHNPNCKPYKRNQKAYHIIRSTTQIWHLKVKPRSATSLQRGWESPLKARSRSKHYHRVGSDLREWQESFDSADDVNLAVSWDDPCMVVLLNDQDHGFCHDWCSMRERVLIENSKKIEWKKRNGVCSVGDKIVF